VPLEAGANDADYEHVFQAIVLPVLYRFDPDLILVSAGFDAHERDPLAGMRMSTTGFAVLNRRLREAADGCAAGRLVLVTEGGYDLEAFAACLASSLAVLEGVDPFEAARPASPRGATQDRLPDATGRGEDAVARTRAAQARYWPDL
jgi:acetoin utilization deacetylase AcuC-like enzyme